jgi:predicted phage terminase large subunit-like protein
VNLPALAEENDPLGRERGEALCPDRYDVAALEDRRATLGSYSFEALYQQRPAPPEGGTFKRHWWNYWQYPGQNLPPVPVKLPSGAIELREAVELPPLEDEIQSWDMSFKDKKGSDFVCGQVWGKRGADRFLKAQKKDRLAFTATCAAVREMTAAHPKAHTKLVEDKANGTAVIDTLRHEIPGMIAVEPEGGKESRANAVSPQVEAGNVYLPHPAQSPWVHELINSAAAFPNGAHDDDVDAMTQALIRMMHRKRAWGW